LSRLPCKPPTGPRTRRPRPGRRKRTTIRIHAEDLSGNRSAVKTYRITRI